MWGRFWDYPSITPTFSFNKFPFLFYFRFILLLTLFYTDHLVSIVVFNYDYLNSMTTLCICFNSLYHHFVNLNFICNNDNLYIRLSIHFTYDTEEEIIDFEIYLSIISNNVILMLFFPHSFKWLFDIIWYIYIYIYIYICMYQFICLIPPYVSIHSDTYDEYNMHQFISLLTWLPVQDFA